jgi:hypothetical protein
MARFDGSTNVGIARYMTGGQKRIDESAGGCLSVAK